MTTRETDHQALQQLAEGYLDRFVTYHDHKETMAYAGYAAYVAAFGGALVASNWPPPWACSSPWLRFLLSCGLATLAWLLALWFVGWQLQRRRLAAIRVAGSERLLNRLLTGPLSDDDLKTWNEAKRGPESHVKEAWWHTLWPSAAPLPTADLEDDRFPAAITAAWRFQQFQGTAAKEHERALVAAGWLLWLALVVKTALIVF